MDFIFTLFNISLFNLLALILATVISMVTVASMCTRLVVIWEALASPFQEAVHGITCTGHGQLNIKWVDISCSDRLSY